MSNTRTPNIAAFQTQKSPRNLGSMTTPIEEVGTDQYTICCRRVPAYVLNVWRTVSMTVVRVLLDPFFRICVAVIDVIAIGIL